MGKIVAFMDVYSNIAYAVIAVAVIAFLFLPQAEKISLKSGAR